MYTENKPLGMVVGGMMKSMFRVLKERTHEQTDTQLTIHQFGLLFAIYQKKEEVTQKDMANFMGRNKSAILRMIDLLEKKELLKRVIDQKDKRCNQLVVTEKGEKTIEEYLTIEQALTIELLEGLPECEVQAFFKVIEFIKSKSELMYSSSN